MDWPAGVERRQGWHGRRLLPRMGAVAERAAPQPVPDVHSAKGDVRRFVLGFDSPRRGVPTQRRPHVGDAHQWPHRPEHRVPQLDGGLPLGPAHRHGSTGGPNATVLAGLGDAQRIRFLLGRGQRRKQVGRNRGPCPDNGRLVRPVLPQYLYQLQRSEAARADARS